MAAIPTIMSPTRRGRDLSTIAFGSRPRTRPPNRTIRMISFEKCMINAARLTLTFAPKRDKYAASGETQVDHNRLNVDFRDLPYWSGAKSGDFERLAPI